ncbi:MAG: GAF domain-containing protein, partial [Fischerella sp.]|nr:GAF domain-containing protein [Fischerella sp.]
ASDAYTDPRTCEFGTAYLPAVGVTSMLDAPIWLEGEMIGVVCHEYTSGVRHWTIEEQNFAGCIADLVTLVIEADRRQKAQQALQQSEAKFHKLTAHMPGIIYQFLRHPDGSVEFPYVSSYSREMFELEPEQIQQNAQLALGQIHPEDRQSLDESITFSAQTLQPWRWEGRFITPSGKLKWLSGASRPEKLANGSILWDGLLIDITERKRTEAVLAKRERYLAILVEVQRRLLADDTDGNCYAYILEQLGQASGASRVYMFENHTDETGRWLASQRVEWCAEGIIAEIDRPALQNLPLQEFFPSWTEAIGRGEIVAGTVTEFPQPEQRILASRKVLSILVLPLIVNNQFWGFIGFDNCQEARLWDSLEVDLLATAAAAIALHQERALAEKALFQAKDELEIEVEKRTKALRDTNQQLLVEIAERSAAQRALQISLENLKKAQAQLVQSEKMSSLGQMVAGIAHEINNPISFIVGNLGYANAYIS